MPGCFRAGLPASKQILLPMNSGIKSLSSPKCKGNAHERDDTEGARHPAVAAVFLLARIHAAAGRDRQRPRSQPHARRARSPAVAPPAGVVVSSFPYGQDVYFEK